MNQFGIVMRVSVRCSGLWHPPWKDLNPAELDVVDQKAWKWIGTNKLTRPVGGNQLKEAFAWRATEVLGAEGSAALLLPAMTLFKYESTAFRKQFLADNQLWSVANFANLAEVLFAGRSRIPAAAVFFSRVDASASDSIEVYSPMVANQPANHGGAGARRQDTWNIVVNTSELQEIQYKDVSDGGMLLWKLAMWGLSVDLRLLQKMEVRFQTIGQMEDSGFLTISEGPKFVNSELATDKNSERRHDLVGKRVLGVDTLKNRRFLFRFPGSAIRELEPSETFLSKRAGVAKKLSVCEPPHVLVGVSGNFAVYTNAFLIVPPGQIGIISQAANRSFLKALGGCAT